MPLLSLCSRSTRQSEINHSSHVHFHNYSNFVELRLAGKCITTETPSLSVKPIQKLFLSVYPRLVASLTLKQCNTCSTQVKLDCPSHQRLCMLCTHRHELCNLQKTCWDYPIPPVHGSSVSSVSDLGKPPKINYLGRRIAPRRSHEAPRLTSLPRGALRHKDSSYSSILIPFVIAVLLSYLMQLTLLAPYLLTMKSTLERRNGGW